MSTPRARVRRRRSGPVVAVTGAAGGLGREMLPRLAAASAFRKVVAIDASRGGGTGVTWRVADVCDPRLAGRLSDIDVVIHLASDTSLESDPKERRAFNVRAVQTVLTASAASAVRRVVLVTSAMVYGARPDNPVPLDEDTPLRAGPDTGLAGDCLEIEDVARQSRRTHPGLAVTLVRPAALVGPGVDTVVTRHFEAPRLLVVKGAHPRWQFCHVEDLASALELAAVGKVHDQVAVGCDGWLEQADIEEISGRRRVELPAQITFGTAERLHRFGVTPAPASDLYFVIYPWVVSTSRLRAAGWKPVYDNEAALRVLLEQASGRHAVVGRRLDRKEATITAASAAGATVAMIGTAAIVRKARKRRNG